VHRVVHDSLRRGRRPHRSLVPYGVGRVVEPLPDRDRERLRAFRGGDPAEIVRSTGPPCLEALGQVAQHPIVGETNLSG